LLKPGYDVASLHDPEMLPFALAAGLMHRRIVFDVHENVPAQLETKPWIPRPLRRPAAAIARWMLLAVERRGHVTLAEEGYSDLFRRDHPVFPNYISGTPPKPRDPDDDVGIVYLGDVTEARGLVLAVEAVALAGARTMTVMGRCSVELRRRLLGIATRHGLDLKLHGFVTPNDALRITSGASMGLAPLLDLPNYARSLPTKVLEYLAVGVPTLASDLPGTRDAVGDKPGVVLVPPGDLEAWRTSIREAMHDEPLRQAARDGAAAIVEQYVWPAEAVADFYQGVLTG
jgi:glycosyltransferase involved in cell wall biosynthesis